MQQFSPFELTASTQWVVSRYAKVQGARVTKSFSPNEGYFQFKGVEATGHISSPRAGDRYCTHTRTDFPINSSKRVVHCNRQSMTCPLRLHNTSWYLCHGHFLITPASPPSASWTVNTRLSLELTFGCVVMKHSSLLNTRAPSSLFQNPTCC